MGKKRQTNISKRIKTSHKKQLVKRKIVTQKVDNSIKNINKVITDLTNRQMKEKV